MLDIQIEQEIKDYWNSRWQQVHFTSLQYEKRMVLLLDMTLVLQ